MGRLVMRRFEVSSELDASIEEVWAHATSPTGVNYEMAPWLRMTFPRNTRDLTEAWEPGRTLFRSWLLLGGVLPLEYDDVAFAAVEPPRRFQECSVLLSQRRWEHERLVEPVAPDRRGARKCRVTDRLAFEPRIAVLGAIYEAIFREVFAHRHRRLRKRFGKRHGT
jgi:ligand-binding SRPBCC domain-containing protein